MKNGCRGALRRVLKNFLHYYFLFLSSFFNLNSSLKNPPKGDFLELRRISADRDDRVKDIHVIRRFAGRFGSSLRQSNA
jgi:hypothetical protein